MTYRQVGYGVGAVLGLLAAYYVAPVALAIISLGEICAYSPAGTSLCKDVTPATKDGPRLPTTFPVAGGKLCRKAGIRYAGTTVQGAEVCFTLTPDRSKWVEIGFTFVRASGCPHKPGETSKTGTAYIDGPDVLTSPGRITVPGFTATIRGRRASGMLEDSQVCGSKRFKWSARRAP
jgi:hypothetical protein